MYSLFHKSSGFPHVKSHFVSLDQWNLRRARTGKSDLLITIISTNSYSRLTYYTISTRQHGAPGDTWWWSLQNGRTNKRKRTWASTGTSTKKKLKFKTNTNIYIERGVILYTYSTVLPTSSKCSFNVSLLWVVYLMLHVGEDVQPHTHMTPFTCDQYVGSSWIWKRGDHKSDDGICVSPSSSSGTLPLTPPPPNFIPPQPTWYLP